MEVIDRGTLDPPGWLLTFEDAGGYVGFISFYRTDLCLEEEDGKFLGESLGAGYRWDGRDNGRGLHYEDWEVRVCEDCVGLVNTLYLGFVYGDVFDRDLPSGLVVAALELYYHDHVRL